MAVRFDCPHCKTNYEVADELSGKTIMCRACQKRGQVRSASGTLATAAGSTAGIALASSVQSRRKFVMIGALSVASLASIATGAILSRKPWRAWTATTEDDRPPWRRGPGGPPPEKGGPPADGGKGGEKGPTA